MALYPKINGGCDLLAKRSPILVRANGQHLNGRQSFGPGELDAGVVLELGHRIVLLLHRAAHQPEPAPSLGLIGQSRGIQEARRQVLRVAKSKVPVLLSGETGTGKSLLAQTIHQQSAQRGGPFLQLDFASLPVHSAAATLFGSVPGVSPNTVQSHHGYFGMAHGGTLLLRSIELAPVAVQSSLLRVIETGEVCMVGKSQAHRVDVRVVVSTRADLRQRITESRFRLSLLSRMGAYQISLPPLRQRRDDIARLLLHFLQGELAAIGLGQALKEKHAFLPAGLFAAACRHQWPGNVRQLRMFAQQVVRSQSHQRDLLQPFKQLLAGTC